MRLDKESIKQILAINYGVNPMFCDITELAHGAENTNYLVRSMSRQFVLRIYNSANSVTGKRDIKSIRLEHEFMKHASRNGVKVPDIILLSDGSEIGICQSAGKQVYFTAFEYIKGVVLTKLDRTIAGDLSGVVEGLWRTSMEVDSLAQPEYDVYNRAVKQYQEFKKAKNDLTEKLTHHMDELYHYVESHAGEVLPRLKKGLVHGDVKLGNLIFSEGKHNKLQALLDFDDYRYSYLLEDLVMLLMHNMDMPEQNIIRSGLFNKVCEDVKEPDMKSDMKIGLDFLLKTRLLYDISKYLVNGKLELVRDILSDKNVKDALKV